MTIEPRRPGQHHIIQIGQFVEGSPQVLSHWIFERGDVGCEQTFGGQIVRLGGWTIDELREIAREAGTLTATDPRDMGGDHGPS